MTTIQEHSTLTLTEQRARETRICAQCGLDVPHPFVDRCPRCFAPLPRIQVECTGCMHRISCPVGKDQRR